MALAKVVRLKTADGLMGFTDNIEVGRTYEADLGSLCKKKFFNVEVGRPHTKEVILCRLGSDGEWGWLPTELLEVES